MLRTNTNNTVSSLVRRASLKMALGATFAFLGGSVLLPSVAQSQLPDSQRPAFPTKLEFDSKPINFRSGIPVGGWSHLTIYSDGHFHFSGHFHDSGAPSYNVGLAWMVRSRSGQAFLFPKNGRMHGTFESGSRNCDWDVSGMNGDIRRNWSELIANNRAECRTAVNADLSSLIASAKQAVEAVGQVVKVVQVITP